MNNNHHFQIASVGLQVSADSWTLEIVLKVGLRGWVFASCGYKWWMSLAMVGGLDPAHHLLVSENIMGKEKDRST